MCHLPTSCYLVLLTIIVGWSASCFPDDYDRCGDGFEFRRNDCYKIESKPLSDDRPNGAGADGGAIEMEEWFGSPCTCEGDLCTIAGVPTFFLGTVVGCDNIPKEWPGAVLGCMETYTGEIGNHSYYAQGFCTLIASACEGDEIICNVGIVGDFQKMTTCPENTVMVTTDYSLSVSGLNAILYQKLCAPVCERDQDCRVDDFDETTDSPGQYECIHQGAFSFCYDARNLADGYTAEVF